MSDYSQVPIIQCSYQLALAIHGVSSRFPKNLRYQLGERLCRSSQDFLEASLKANFIRDAKQRWHALDALSARLLTLRMAKDLKGISYGQFASINARIEDIQKQLTGWSKWTQSKIPRGDSTRDTSSPRTC